MTITISQSEYELLLKNAKKPNYTDAEDLAQAILDNPKIRVIVNKEGLHTIAYNHIFGTFTIKELIAELVGEDHFLDVSKIIVEKLEVDSFGDKVDNKIKSIKENG